MTLGTREGEAIVVAHNRERWIRLGAAAAFSMIVVFLQVGWFSEIFRSPDPAAAAHRDWIQFHRTALRIVSGQAQDVYPAELLGREGSEGSDGFFFLYAPFTALITLPLAFLSRIGAYLACVGAVAVGTVLSTLAFLRVLKVTSAAGLLAVLGVLASAPWNGAVLLGHLSALLVLAPALALLAWARGNAVLAGCCFALLLAKPNWGLPFVLFLMLGRHWRMLGGFLLGGVFLWLVSLPLGPELWGDWARSVMAYRDFITVGIPPWKQVTLRATYESLSGRIAPDPVVQLLWVSTAGPLFLGAGLAWFRFRGRREHFPRLLGVALLAILVANPYAHFYDALLAMPAGIVLWTQPTAFRRPPLRRRAMVVSGATYLWMLLQVFVLTELGPSLVGLGLAVWLAVELLDLFSMPVTETT
jgi:hypothetical protein